jgi:hypothetical protein
VRAQQGEHDSLVSEPQASRMRDAAIGQLDPVGLTKVLAVVVERGQRRRLRAGDLHQQLELQALVALIGCQHSPTAAEERVAGVVELGREAERPEQLQPPLRPFVAPVEHDVRLADAHQLVLVEDLAPRRVQRRLMPEHPRTACIDEHASRRQPSSRRDRWIDRVAGRRHQRQLGHLLKLAPVLVAAGALALQRRLRFAALERVHAPSQMRKRGQITAGLQLAPGQHRRETQLLSPAGRRLGAQALVQTAAHVLEHRAVSVNARGPGLQQQAGPDQLGHELGLIRRSRAGLRRHRG